MWGENFNDGMERSDVAYNWVAALQHRGFFARQNGRYNLIFFWFFFSRVLFALFNDGNFVTVDAPYGCYFGSFVLLSIINTHPKKYLCVCVCGSETSAIDIVFIRALLSFRSLQCTYIKYGPCQIPTILDGLFFCVFSSFSFFLQLALDSIAVVTCHIVYHFHCRYGKIAATTIQWIVTLCIPWEEQTKWKTDRGGGERKSGAATNGILLPKKWTCKQIDEMLWKTKITEMRISQSPWPNGMLSR